jgi:hypothetical protein
MVTKARTSPPRGETYEPVPCCEFCLGEYLAGIPQQWRTPATRRYWEAQQNCMFDLCDMHWRWYYEFMRRLSQCTTTSK